MPCFRGIDISVLANAECQQLPEFPHPDGSSVRLRASNEPGGGFLGTPQQSVSSLSTESDPTRMQKINPRVSVYIPSLPGVQFWLRYRVTCGPSHGGHLFFKMSMNGRPITAWGIDPKQKAEGSVVRALYEPSDRWHHTENGTQMRQEGIESRYFYFVPGREKSIAEDGGLIEVQVFRAKARKRRAVQLDEFRNQEKYGITSPSGGLVDNPEDATYYYWQLVDPKDAPYASFRFHYRSWSKLKYLNLMHTSCSQVSIEALINSSKQMPREDAMDLDPNNETDQPFTFDVTSLDGAIFDEQPDEEATPDGRSQDQAESAYFLKSPPPLLPAALSEKQVPQPSKAIRDGFRESYLQRPLPELPQVDVPDTSSYRSRTSSMESHAASIAPSLLPYVDNDVFLGEEVEICTAKKIALGPDSAQDSLWSERPASPSEEHSESDYETSPPSTGNSGSPKDTDLLPRRYVAIADPELEQRLSKCSEHPQGKDLPRGILKHKHTSVGTDNADGGLELPRVSTLQLTESEWMRRTPSPTSQGLADYGPRPDGKPGSSIFSQSLRTRLPLTWEHCRAGNFQPAGRDGKRISSSLKGEMDEDEDQYQDEDAWI